MDLSSPEDHSVNASIPPELCSLRYPSFNATAWLILAHGPGALLSKLEAYWMVLVHPDDWFLMAMRWKMAYYVDT